MTAALLTVPAVPAAATADGAVGSGTVVPLQVTGAPAKRFNLIIMGDGYTASEQSAFAAAPTSSST